jgi:hypothetical protein
MTDRPKVAQSIAHPPFIDVRFYPGYSYNLDSRTFKYAPGRYIGLTATGEVWQCLCEAGATWTSI